MFREREAARYDAVPYPDAVYSATHPGRLFVCAGLFGLDAADVRSARVLELGCASGLNLIAMAEQLPAAEFVGVDLSADQIEAGSEVVSALGLDNVSLLQRDLATLGPELGQFDYIVAHGLYSWVPRDIRAHILRVLRERLSDVGVGYLSFNTNPGWRMRGMVRDMMLYHTARYDSPEEQIAQAHALLGFLVGATKAEKPYGALLRQEVDLLADLPPTHQSQYVFHDHLASVNEPMWFHEFAAELAMGGMQYLCESDLWRARPSQLAPAVAQTLIELRGDFVRTEQYLDFVVNRHFRKSLVVAAGRSFDREVSSARVGGWHVAAPVTFTGTVDLRNDDDVEFSSFEERSVTAGPPLLKALFVELGERWPASVSVSALVTRVVRRSGRPDSDIEAAGRIIGNELVRANAHGLVELLATERQCVSELSTAPEASPLARWMSQFDVDTLPSRAHSSIHVDDLGRAVVRLLDGSRNATQVAAELVALVQAGELEVFSDGEPVTEQEMLSAAFAEMMPGMLERLLKSSILVA